MQSTAATESQSHGLAKVRDLSSQLQSFYADVRTEMKKVTHPSFKDVRGTTLVVLATVALFGVYFFVVDFILTHVLDGVFTHFSH